MNIKIIKLFNAHLANHMNIHSCKITKYEKELVIIKKINATHINKDEITILIHKKSFVIFK